MNRHSVLLSIEKAFSQHKYSSQVKLSFTCWKKQKKFPSGHCIDCSIQYAYCHIYQHCVDMKFSDKQVNETIKNNIRRM